MIATSPDLFAYAEKRPETTRRVRKLASPYFRNNARSAPRALLIPETEVYLDGQDGDRNRFCRLFKEVWEKIGRDDQAQLLRYWKAEQHIDELEMMAGGHLIHETAEPTIVANLKANRATHSTNP